MRPPYGADRRTASAGSILQHRSWCRCCGPSTPATGPTAPEPSPDRGSCAGASARTRPTSCSSTTGSRTRPRRVAARAAGGAHDARQRGYCFGALDEHGRPGFPTPVARVAVRGRGRARHTRRRHGAPGPAHRPGHQPRARHPAVSPRLRARTTRPSTWCSGSPPVRCQAARPDPGASTTPSTSRPGAVRGEASRTPGRAAHRTGRGTVAIADRDPDRRGCRPSTSPSSEPAGEAVTVPVRLRLARASGRPGSTLLVRTVTSAADERTARRPR